MLFGIPALLVVGASWCLVGVVYGRAPKEGIDTKLVQLCSALVSVTCSITIALFFVRPDFDACPKNVMYLALASYFFSGIFNYAGVQAMAEGMKYGPNGAVWGIMQSALVFPFLVGIFFFGEPLTIFRGSGLICLVVALIFFAKAKNAKAGTNENYSPKWRYFALLSLAVISIQQNLSTIPSYFEEARNVSPVLRAMAGVAGSLIASAVRLGIVGYKDGDELKKVFSGLKNWHLYLYVFGMQFFSLIFAYTLFYPGMDAMGKAGAASICYPMMVGSCIVSFTLYAVFGLKEKLTWTQGVALIFCAIGLAGLCFPKEFGEFFLTGPVKTFANEVGGAIGAKLSALYYSVF